MNITLFHFFSFLLSPAPFRKAEGGGKSVCKEQRIRFRILLTADFIVGARRIFVNLFSMRSPKNRQNMRYIAL